MQTNVLNTNHLYIIYLIEIKIIKSNIIINCEIIINYPISIGCNNKNIS